MAQRLKRAENIRYADPKCCHSCVYRVPSPCRVESVCLREVNDRATDGYLWDGETIYSTVCDGYKRV